MRQRIDELEQYESEYKPAKKVLRDSQERYRNIIEQSFEGFSLINNKGIIIEWNKAQERITGLRNKDVLGKPAWDIQFQLAPADLKTSKMYKQLKSGMLADLQAIDETWNDSIQEQNIQCPDGKFKTVQSTSFKIMTDNEIMIGAIMRDVTEKILAEKASNEAHNIINKSPIVVFLWCNQESWPVEYVTENIKSVLGYTANDFISGKIKYSQIIHKDDLNRVSDEVKKYSKDKNREDFIHEPYRVFCKDGSVRWLDDRTFIRRDKSDRITHYQGIILDNTARKQAEEALRENESRLRALVSSIDEIVFEFEEDGQYANIWVTDEKLLVRPKNELLGSTIGDVLGHKEAKPFTEVIKRVISSGISETIEYSLDVMGGKRWFSGRVNPIISVSGKPNRASFIARDITERKIVEEALIDSENKMRSIFRVAPTGIGLVKNRVLLEVNPKICEITGYLKEELIGKNSRILYPSDKEFEFVGKEKYHQISKYGTGVVETKWKKKDGTVIDILLASTPVNVKNNSKGVTFTALDITKRKNTEEALRESEERFRTMFETNQAVMLLIDPNSGKIEDANPAACKFYGYTHAKIVKELYIHHINILTKNEIKIEMRNVLNSKRNYFEFKHRLANGDIRNVETYSSKTIIKDKELLYSIIHDVTERKQAEEKLLESEQLYHAVIEQSHDLIFLVDTESKLIIEVSPAMKKLLGYSSKELISLSLYDLIAHDKQSIDRNIKKILADGYKFIGEREYVRKDGSKVDVEVSVSLISNKDKNVLCIVSRDITERKKAENEIRESEAKFKAIIQNVNEGIIYADNQGSIIHVNEAISRMVGIPIKDIIGENVIILAKQLVSAKQIPKILKKIAIAIKGKSLKPFELEYNDRTLEISTTYDKSLKKITGIIRDITERKQFEKVLSENEEKLRNVVENSTNLFYSHTIDHEITYISPKCREFLQCEPEEAMIRWTDFVTNNPVNEKGFAFTKKAIKTGKRQPPYELELIGKEGKIIQVEVNEAPIKHKNKTIGIVGSLTDITERKKVEGDLYVSEKLLRQVIDASPYTIYVKDKEGRYILVNKKMAESHNTTPKKLVGKTDLSVAKNWLTTPEKIKKFRESELNVINGKKPMFIKEDKFTFLDGSERWFQTIKSPISLKDNPDCLMGVAVDITERKQAEISLINEKLISEEYINSLPGLFYIFDEERFIRWNKEWIRITGYSNEELSQMYGTDFFEGKDKELIAKRMQEVFINGSSEAEADIITKNGKRIPYYFSGMRKEFNGKPHLIGLGIDITELKEAEKALQESEEKYRLIVENANDGIEISQNDKIFFANSCFANMLGYTNEEIKNIPISKIFTEQGTRELIERNEKRDKGQPLPNHYETTFRKKDGTIIDVDIKYEIIQYKNEPATFAIIRDITLRKQVEKEKEILEKQLRRSQKLETIGTLAGGIAHDFNNILAPIMGYTDMALLNLEKTNPLYDDLQHVLKGAHRAKDLVKQILLFSKQSEKERQPLALQSIVKKALKFIRPSIPTIIEIQQRIDDSCAKVQADATQINQVIINLCTNAWQVMEEKGGTLTIELIQVNIDTSTAKLYPNLNEAEYVKLSVTDTGPGMDEETQERIFEPFFTTKTLDKGTGLGLSVVHGIVRGHKGDIHVHSRIGKGTTFHVYLPTIKSEETSIKTEDVEIFGGSECVLVVDDELAVSELVKRILENFGYKAKVFKNGLDALQAFKKKPGEFDLIISDLTMPKMTGLDLADRLHKEYPDFPVMIMTGFGDSLTETTRERYGIKNVISKPIVVKDLTAAVRKIFDK